MQALDDNCIFCKIIKGEIPAKVVYEDDYCIAFNDINPQMPIHVVVAAKKHISSVLGFEKEDVRLVRRLLYASLDKIHQFCPILEVSSMPLDWSYVDLPTN